ncbi:NADPH-dependent FMN reductase [Motiliproteus sp.]|uniref:NADPH-dependent FMN reductase n=1 Tax=Motiliproteus sp. TaxID=1898955 RepID=UPI003BAD28C8
MTQLIALSGSLRANSFNQQLVEIAAEGAREQGVEVRVINLADYPMPLFSEDLEAEGVPAIVNDLKQQFAESQGILLASPEYNGSISGVLKNAIDWLSRPSAQTDIGPAFAGKVAGIMATSPGGLGGIRGLVHARDVLFNLGVTVSPNQVAVPSAYQAFDEQGQLSDAETAERVKGLGAQIAQMAQKLA